MPRLTSHFAHRVGARLRELPGCTPSLPTLSVCPCTSMRSISGCSLMHAAHLVEQASVTGSTFWIDAATSRSRTAPAPRMTISRPASPCTRGQPFFFGSGSRHALHVRAGVLGVGDAVAVASSRRAAVLLRIGARARPSRRGTRPRRRGCRRRRDRAGSRSSSDRARARPSRRGRRPRRRGCRRRRDRGGQPFFFGSSLATPFTSGQASSASRMPSPSRSGGQPFFFGSLRSHARHVGAGVLGVGDAVAVGVDRSGRGGRGS